VKLLTEVGPAVDFFFLDQPVVDEDSWAKVMTGTALPTATAMLAGVLADLPTVSWDHDALKGLVERVGVANDLKLGKAQAPVRVALTGRTVGPPLFEAMEILGREVTITRLRDARARLG
jgi:glutamyl-tRNA synthetase